MLQKGLLLQQKRLIDGCVGMITCTMTFKKQNDLMASNTLQDIIRNVFLSDTLARGRAVDVVNLMCNRRQDDVTAAECVKTAMTITFAGNKFVSFQNAKMQIAQQKKLQINFFSGSRAPVKLLRYKLSLIWQ